MKKHPYRAALIWLVAVASLINIYPTVGWMLLSDEAREARLAMWQQEDDALAAQKPSYMRKTWSQLRRWAQFDRSRVINLGLDLQGGIHMVLGFDVNDLPADVVQAYRDDNYNDSQIEQELQETVLQQIRRRVHDFEADEPIIQSLGSNQIQVQLPGEKDIERARRLITMAAVLNFHIVAGIDETIQVFTKIRDQFPDQFTPFIERPTLRGENFRVPAANFERIKRIVDQVNTMSDIVPEDKIIAFSQPPKPFEDQIYELFLIDREPIASGEGLRQARAIPDNMNPPYWQILFMFNNVAGERFGQATEQNINRSMAIVLDGLVVSAPNIRDRITTQGQISGSFEGYEAADLAIALNSGSMAVPIREEYTGVVSGSLPRESVRKGVISALTGIMVVGIFMMIYYMAAGLVAVGALAMNAIMVIAALAYFNLTLTLPGIAGLVLTVGMAVDANVLIFERIREEIRNGHSLLASIDSGFSRAAVTILDANITTLIAAAVLMQFGTGPIEGFAITLSVGVITSVFSALVISRAIIDFLAGRKFISKLNMFSIFRPDTHIPFLQKRTITTACSVIAIILGMGLFTYRGSDNFGVDFTEGTNINLVLRAEQDINAETILTTLVSSGFSTPVVQKVGAGSEEQHNHFLIRLSESEETPAFNADESVEDITVAGRVQQSLASLTDSAAPEAVELQEVQTVGPSVGKQLRNDAIKAVIFALIFIVVYLTIRFEWKYAIAAVIALMHDVLITLGCFALFERQITMPVIAAILTIIGYSLNDTIVVFDRIRESLQTHRGRGYKLIDILNTAINETLGRTLLTSMTTLFVVIVLLLFGGDAIWDFAFVLTIGIIVGTYSSIFVASTVVLFLQTRFGRTDTPQDGARNSGRKKDADKNNTKKPGRRKPKPATA
jgi:SecD/SecF fusion protein